jgi:reprolysin-like metallo-peptidase family M12B
MKETGSGPSRGPWRPGRLGVGVLALAALAAGVVVAMPAGAGSTRRALRDAHGTRAFWHGTSLKTAIARSHARQAVRARTDGVHAFTLQRAKLRQALAKAPKEFTRAARVRPAVISLPAPNGRFQRFALARSAIMSPGLQRKHPRIRTYSGYGIDDAAATIHADISPFGFHASVRSPNGGWYIDPYFRQDPNLYVSYHGAQLKESFPFVEHELKDGDGAAAAAESADAPDANPPTGSVLRNYRLALITDPGYAAYVGGPSAVTAAKVALMNRVDQVYEDDLSIRMQLIPNNDLLNLNTWDAATAPNGPCGAAACFTQAQVTGCSSTARARFVIGQIIGASNYDIGHLALGQPGGGVANLGVVGRSNKAGGCTGIPTPVGDFYAIDYVAHEMGHQFSGNHPFNGNQLNCSGGNRNANTSVEPGSGSSIMAYAGICLTDDLQRHSDPYFSQRSQQEITTYTTSNQLAINEVQTTSLRHFGGGNEVQTVTFGPGYSQVATVQPLTVTINAAPSATSRGGAEEHGTTVTIATPSAHTLQVGDTVTIAGVGEAGYNGTFTVTAVPTTRSFQYTNTVSGLPTSGGGTVALAAPGLTESGNTVTVRTAAAHNRAVGDVVTIAGAGVAGYNGTFAVTAVPSPRSFEVTNPTAGLANSGGGSATYFAPFQVRIGGNDSAVIGGTGLAYTAANIQSAINAIAGFAGTVTVSNATSTGFTVAYGGASAGTDVPNLALVNLSCGGCFASTEETNHGGAFDSFTLTYDGATSAPIVNGTNYTQAGLTAALQSILPAGATFTLNAFGGGNINGLNTTGFQVTFTGTLAGTNVPTLLQVGDFTSGASGFVGETDKGGPVDNQGTTTPTGNSIPDVSAPAQYTIPLRTPFALTGSASDADGDALTYSWEQNDRGASPNAAGTSLLINTKTNGPLFAMFPFSGQISDQDSLEYNSPGENHLGNDPTRVFPDLQQILDNNTNADTGSCPPGPIAQPVPQASTECYAEFLPTSDYVGVAGVNADPLALHMRFTARDGRGGSNFADTTLLLANTAGPFHVTSPNTAVSLPGESTQTVTWDVASTDVAPVSAANVKISLSVDRGHTYPYVLAASTPNTGSASVVLPMVGTTQARVKIEAVDNVFFDVSNADFAITWPYTGFFSPIANPPAVNPAKAGSAVPVKFSLGGDRGLAILANGYPASRQVDCVTGAPIGSLEPTSSDLGLTFANGQYSYVWKTAKDWVGTCRQLQVLLVDGTLHTAQFSFK